MNSIKMDRLKLLKIVLENKEKHVAEFLEAVEDYKKLALEVATANLKLAKTGDLAKIKAIKPTPSEPKSYEDSYKRAIRMLELSIDDTIEIEEEIFNQLVLDEWTWKRSFSMSNAFYKTGIGSIG